MSDRRFWRLAAPPCMVTIALVLAPGGPARPEAAQQPDAASARAIAPIDLTGYWVSVVNEDWRYRMVTPQKGDYGSVPLTPAARTAAESWDLSADNASGNQCKPFGVGNIMRQPGRLHVTWQDDTTLKIETDAGTQTRLLHFGPPMAPSGDKTWQGYSVARWEGPGVQAQGRGGRGRGGPAREGGSLHVDTTHFRAGYLRTNGVPYSENAIISENFDLLPMQDNGDEWLLVVTTVEDPLYLNQPFLTSTHFKREPDGSKWSPSPCSTDPLGTPTLRRR